MDSGSHSKRKQQSLSLKRFAHSKQHDTKIVRELKKNDALRKAKIVKSYKRLLKEEGYEVCHDTDDAEKTVETDDTDKQTQEVQKKKRRKALLYGDNRYDKNETKTNSFAKALTTAEDMKKQREQRAIDEAQKLKTIARKHKERKERRRKLTQTTRKGQPIMRHKMEQLLGQIERKNV